MFVFAIATSCLLGRQPYNLLGRVLHTIRNCEVQTGFANDALTFFDVGSFETDNYRNADA